MSRLFQRSLDAFDAPLDEVLMLLNVPTGRYHELNAPGARIWELLAEPMTEAAIVSALLDQYEVDPGVCEDAVRDFLQMLEHRNLLGGG